MHKVCDLNDCGKELKEDRMGGQRTYRFWSHLSFATNKAHAERFRRMMISQGHRAKMVTRYNKYRVPYPYVVVVPA